MKNTRIAPLGAIVAVTALALTACSGGGGSPAPSDGAVAGELTVAFDATFKDSIEPTVAEFEKRYPDATVNVDYVGADLLATVSTQAQAGTLPDVFLSVPGPAGGPAFSVGVLGSQGYLADLTDTSWAAEIPDNLKGSVSVDDKVLAYPGALQGLGTIYNTTLLDSLGLEIPATWDDLIQLCSDAEDKGVYALANGQGGDGSTGQMPYIDLIGSVGFGPDQGLLEDTRDGSLDFADSPWKETFAKYKELADAGCFGEGSVGRDRSQALGELAAGKALAMVDVGAQIGALAEQAPDSEFTQIPLPANDDVYFSAAPGYVIAVSANAKNPSAARAFLDVLAEPEFINSYVTAFAGVPVIPNDEFEAPSSLTTLVEAVASGKVTNYADLGISGAVNTLAQQEAQKLVLGDHSVDQVMEALQSEYDAG